MQGHGTGAVAGASNAVIYTVATPSGRVVRESPDLFEQAETEGLEDTFHGMASWLRDAQKDDRLLLLRKHLDYGAGNIGNAPGGAINGLLVRMHDKMERLKHLAAKGGEPQNESVLDTLVDLGNYCLIYRMVLDGVWPE